MKADINILLCFCRRFSLAVLWPICLAGSTQAAEGQPPEVNVFGWPVRDAEGRGINYTPEQLAAKANSIAPATASGKSNRTVAPQGFVSAQAGSPPFWQYSIFGSGIGLSNIIIGPASASGAREIIIGGNSGSNFNDLFLPDNFWQVIRRNSATGDYDHLFVSPIYSARIKRIATGNVLGDSQEEITVMLADGRIYFYDRATKTELGSINTGISGLEGLSLADLDGDGFAEIIVTTANDLFVFNGAGSLLWQVPGAGGFEVVVGQMDNDPALEIATTKGSVVDAATHTGQWTARGGFSGNHLRLAPLPGSSYQQLIVAQSAYWISAYDVAAQQKRWSFHTPENIAALEVADVDNDGIPEVIFGDGQNGQIHVYDLITQTQKWAMNNPEYGCTNIAVGDVDNDGVADLLWGAGWGTTGPDYLYVASTTGSHAIKWQNVDLQGPFLGPAIGDLDGDGQPELVICSYESRSTYFSGRILVFDATTMALRAISDPLQGALYGVYDLKLRDLEGDGRMEIMLASDSNSDASIDIYSFDSANTFTLKWQRSEPILWSSRSFNLVEAADLDGNGTPEIIGGNTRAYGSAAATLYTYDYPYALTPWQFIFSSGSYEVNGLVVGAFGENGGTKIAALNPNGDLYTFDGRTRELESYQRQTGATIVSRRWPSGLITGDSAGVGHFLQYANTSYSENFSVQLGSTALSGINMLSNGELWAGVDGRLSLRLPPSYDNPVWESSVIGPASGRFVANDHRNGQNRIFSSAQHAVAGFVYESPLPFPSPTATPAPTPTPLPVNPNNILVSIGNWSALVFHPFNGVREFTPTGSLVQTIPFSYNNESYPQTEYLRDIIVEEGGTIASYNGTFAPFLTRCSLTTGAFSHTSHSGWSSGGSSYYGGIAAYHNFIYLTDMNTASPGDPNGIVRFDTSINLAARFASGNDFTRLDVGLDGNLYAYANQSPTKINVYNPVTMTFLRQITLPSGVNVGGFAVDQLSRIFVCGGVNLFRLNSNGTLEISKSIGVTGHGLTDIAIDDAGRLALVQDDGRVFLGDTTLANNFTSFSATSDWSGSSNGRFSVSFARPISGVFSTPTPTPTSPPVPTPTPTPTPIPSLTPTPNPTPSPTPPGRWTPTPAPIPSPTPTPTPTPTPGACVVVTATAGNTGPAGYSTVKKAFDAINDGTHQGLINIAILCNTTETSAVLNASGAGSASYTSVLISPSGARTISGTAPAGSPLIDLNGADNVTIDGLNVGGNSLTISNASTSSSTGTSTIRLGSGATNNTIANCSILGSSTAGPGYGGTILIGRSNGGLNTGNTISNNKIGPVGTNPPCAGIALEGGTLLGINTSNVIDNNNIFDFFSSSNTVAGISIGGDTDTTIVSNNRIYQTSPRSGNPYRYSGISCEAQGSATITGNTIGFGAANGTGTTTISSSTSQFFGLYLAGASSSTPTSVQGNTISGIRLTTTSTFQGIYLGQGRFDIGNVTGNSIGSLTGASSIIITSGSGGAVYGIYDRTFQSNSISNNNIGAITINGTGTGAGGFKGILVDSTTGTVTLNNNTIGGSGAGAITNTLVGGYPMYGIHTTRGRVSATGNVVQNISGNSNGPSAVVGGLILTSINTGANTISQNVVHSLSNNSGATANSISGISCNFPVASTSVVERNVVHSLSITSFDKACQLAGIVFNAGQGTYKNNMVRLGINADGTSVTGGFQIIGMLEAAGVNNLYFNSVYVGGTGVSDASSTFAFLSNVTGGTRNYLDNIFDNARSNGGGSGKHYAIALSGLTGAASDRNDLYAPGIGGIVGLSPGSVDQPSLGNWQTATGQDAASISADPQFINPNGTAPQVNLHLSGASPCLSTGTPAGGVTTDIDNDLRNSTTPDIGADEVHL